MNTLKDHIILYDAECPMCNVYTRAFTKSGMLEDTGGRASYQDMPDLVCPFVDRQRAVNEIALVNKTTGEVSYGIHSLFKVIAHSFPFFSPLFSMRPFVWLMTKVYAFISYNRKVIIPSGEHRSPLQPAFRLHYRIAYLLFSWWVASLILTAYARTMVGLLPMGVPGREYLICGGQILFQGLVVSLYAPAKRWDYLGNMMTISLAGSLMLIPVMVAIKAAHLSAALAVVCFLAVAGLMLVEHIRRTKLLSLGWLLTISWISYRLMVLFLILKSN